MKKNPSKNRIVNKAFSEIVASQPEISDFFANTLGSKRETSFEEIFFLLEKFKDLAISSNPAFTPTELSLAGALRGVASKMGHLTPLEGLMRMPGFYKLTEYHKKILDLTKAYALLPRTSLFNVIGMTEFEIVRLFSDHLDYLRRKKSGVLLHKTPLTEPELQNYLQLEALSSRDVSRLFRVRPRQVQRWIKESKLRRRGQNGLVLRKDYLEFAKESSKYGDIILRFNRLMEKRSKRDN